MAKMILSTGNIVAGCSSIHQHRPDGSNHELADLLRASFQAAQLDYTSKSLAACHQPLSSPSPTITSWTAREGDVDFVPRVQWPRIGFGLQEERARYDVTVKLFLRALTPAAAAAGHVREALSLVSRALAIQTPLPIADLLVTAFPSVRLDGDCAQAADADKAEAGNLDAEVAVWPALEAMAQNGLVRRLGVADFGSTHLTAFLARVATPPAVDQLILHNCCNVPPQLVELARRQDIELLVHADPPDILSEPVLEELLHAAGVTVPATDQREAAIGRAAPLWVVRYTAVVADRGVIENKGYFVGVELNSSSPLF